MCGGGKQEETQGPSSPKPATPPQATLPTERPKAKVKKPLTEEESAWVIEAMIRMELKKPTGELTKADYEKVKQLPPAKGLEKCTHLTGLTLSNNKLTKLPKRLEKLTQLRFLGLEDNPDPTKTQIDELQKALPKCRISSNPTK